jgi:hypothetical protein
MPWLFDFQAYTTIYSYSLLFELIKIDCIIVCIIMLKLSVYIKI